jgi:hypothetical protein
LDDQFLIFLTPCADNVSYFLGVDFNGRAVECVGLLPVACWDCGFESRRERGCLSVVNVVFCQVQKSLCRAENSSRGVGHRCVCATNLKNVEAISSHLATTPQKQNAFKEAANTLDYLRKATGQLVKSYLETKWK